MAQLAAHQPVDPEIRVQTPGREIICSDYKGITFSPGQISIKKFSELTGLVRAGLGRSAETRAPKT